MLGRENLISTAWREDLFRYITGIVTNHGQKLIAIGGISDHIHILIGLEPNCEISKLVQEIKANSSRWVNQKRYVSGKFNWQEGFGAFSYSRSHLDDVISYIQEQDVRHKERTFKHEYLALLKRFDVEYDETYLFDWIEA